MFVWGREKGCGAWNMAMFLCTLCNALNTH